MHEDVAGLAVADGGLGHARVGTANPKNFRRLALAQSLEEFGFAAFRALGKVSVAREDVFEDVYSDRSSVVVLCQPWDRASSYLVQTQSTWLVSECAMT